MLKVKMIPKAIKIATTVLLWSSIAHANSSNDVADVSTPLAITLQKMGYESVLVDGCRITYSRTSKLNEGHSYQRFMFLSAVDFSTIQRPISQNRNGNLVWVFSGSFKSKFFGDQLEQRKFRNWVRKTYFESGWPNRIGPHNAEIETELKNRFPDLETRNRVVLLRGGRKTTILEDGFSMSHPDKGLLFLFKDQIDEQARTLQC